MDLLNINLNIFVFNYLYLLQCKETHSTASSHVQLLIYCVILYYVKKNIFK